MLWATLPNRAAVHCGRGKPYFLLMSGERQWADVGFLPAELDTGKWKNQDDGGGTFLKHEIKLPSSGNQSSTL